MASPILATKIYPPILKQQVVNRPHLVRLLNESQNFKLTLISAPPGFGKTTALAEWFQQSKVNATWLALDEADNDISRFYLYLIHSVRQNERGIGDTSLAMLEAVQGPSTEKVAINFLNELSTLKHPLSIVLDDYQLIENPEIQTSLSFFIEHLPREVHMVISTRSDPPWKLAKLRSARELMEIRSAELRFSVDETSRFLNSLMALNIAPEDIKALENRTEGWVASLQMAAISMQKMRDVHTFIQNFTGSDRVIFDYLIEEVLHLQSPEIERFLLRTSIFDTFTPEKADYVLESESARKILTDLEKANLFLIPLDNEHHWYRYHHLFRDLLRVHLVHDHRDSVAALHERASKWEEARGNPLAAFRHALSAEDLPGAIRIAESNSLGLLDSGQITDLNRWLNALPQTIISGSSWLTVARAWALAYLGKTEPAENVLKTAEQELEQDVLVPDKSRIRGHIATIRAYVAWMMGNPSAAINFGRVAIELLPEKDTLALSQAWLTLGEGYQNTDQFEASEEALKKANDYSRHLTNSHLHIFSRSFLAFLYSIQDQFTRAENQCLELIKEYEQPDGTYQLLSLANPLATLCQVLTGQGRLDEAIHYGEQAVKLARQWQQVDTWHFSLSCLDQAYTYAGRFDQANELLRESKKIARRTSPWFKNISDRLDVHHHVLQNHLEKVQKWLEEKKFSPEDKFAQHNQEYFIIYRLFLLAQKDYSQALDLSQRMLKYFRRKQDVVSMISALGDMAKASAGLGKIEKAVDYVEQMIVLAEPEHIGGQFIIRGNIMKELLKKLHARGKSSEFVETLLLSFPVPKARGNSEKQCSELPEPLTTREIEIIKQLDSGRSSIEIANELVLSVSTVRTHIKNIYRKLDVNHRIEAIQKARTLGIMS